MYIQVNLKMYEVYCSFRCNHKPEFRSVIGQIGAIGFEERDLLLQLSKAGRLQQ